eukprot:4086962-Alexandrium_andersonii.AAC.1
MSASLVGSEMCIRDRPSPKLGRPAEALQRRPTRNCAYGLLPWAGRAAVSYTHLTLPTICSV